jgi:hypothetical protein
MQQIDLKDKVFGRLTALEYSKIKRKWLCRCECGIEKYMASVNLRMGFSKSCGCLRNEVSKKRMAKRHGARSAE